MPYGENEYEVFYPINQRLFFEARESHLYPCFLLHVLQFRSPHKTLVNPYPRTSAMAAELTDHIWSIDKVVRLIII